MRDALAVLKQKHGQLVKPLVASGVLDAARYSFARWKRAYCLVKALQSVALDDAGTVTLVPWIALSSFGARGNANMHVTNDSSVQLVLSAPVSRGQAVVFNDDLGSNESDNFRLLELFGLLLSKRPFRYYVSVSLDRADPMVGRASAFFVLFHNRLTASSTATSVIYWIGTFPIGLARQRMSLPWTASAFHAICSSRCVSTMPRPLTHTTSATL